MKAILVFNVSKITYEAIDDYFSGDITLHLGNDGFIDFQDVLLKPMPKKKGVSLKEAIGIKCSCYSDGWNECIGEILGEEE